MRGFLARQSRYETIIQTWWNQSGFRDAVTVTWLFFRRSKVGEWDKVEARGGCARGNALLVIIEETSGACRVRDHFHFCGSFCALSNAPRGSLKYAETREALMESFKCEFHSAGALVYRMKLISEIIRSTMSHTRVLYYLTSSPRIKYARSVQHTKEHRGSEVG